MRNERRRRLLDLGGLTFFSVFAAVLWSQQKLLNQDEMFSYQTDTVRSFADVIRIQLHFPISLDPLVYHAAAHASTRVFGATAFAMRLPSMLGYALMLCCVYLFLLRVASTSWKPHAARRIALFGALVPLATATFYYAVEARPYGLLLGFDALALLAWQAATRDLQSRRWALPTLAIAIALALNCHYFAVLLLPPLCLAELVRTMERRNVDLPLLAALGLGASAIVFTLPFMHAVREFRAHYYNAGALGPRAITQTYRSLLVDYTGAGLPTQHWLAILFVGLSLCFVVALVVRRRQLALPLGEAVLLVAMAALPFFGFLLAWFVTHSYEVRYMLPAIFAIAVLLALVLAPLIAQANERDDYKPRWLPYLLGCVVVFTLVIHLNSERRATAATMQALMLPPAVRAALAADPSHALYIQEMGSFEVAQFYQPDAFVREHTTLVYDREREIALTGHDTEALTAEHMQHFTSLPIVSYDSVRDDDGVHTWVLYRDGWDFAHKALRQDHAAITPLAPFFGGAASGVRFPAEH